MIEQHCHTILYNGKVATVDKDFSIAEAVAIANGRFARVGTNEEICALARADTEQIDLKGKMVVPGLIDSHNHANEVGIDALRPNFENCTTLADVVKVIERVVKDTERGKWIISSSSGKVAPENMASALKEGRFPTRWDLDPVSAENPVALFSPHILIVNSYVLRLFNVTKDTPSPPGGEIVKDLDTGEPTGVFKERAAMMMSGYFPSTEYHEYKAELKEICGLYNAVGLTSVVQHGADHSTIRALRELSSDGQLTVRIYTHVWYMEPEKSADEIDADFQRLAYATGRGFGDDTLKVGGIKLVMDGGAGIGTCLQRFKYQSAEGIESHGIQLIPVERFSELSLLAAKNNLRMAVHDTGGRAIDIVLDTWEEVNKEFPIADKRWVNVHCQFPSKKNMKQVKKLGSLIPTQTIFLHTMGSGYVKYYGREVADNAIPVKDWLRNGIRIGLGSDAPINPYDPILGIWHACTRIANSGEVIGPNQRITPAEALRCYTINNAYFSFEEDIKGSIEPGKLADLVVLSNDILTCPIDEIRDSRVLMTMVGGKVVYEEKP